MKKIIICLSTFLISINIFAVEPSFLKNPDSDIKSHYPESTSFRVRELSIHRHAAKNARSILKKIKTDLASDLDDEFEGEKAPLTFYVVYEKNKYVGVMLGTKARFPAGLLELFVAYKPNGQVRDVYIQTLQSPNSNAFRSKIYREQFRKFGLNRDWEYLDVYPPARLPSAEMLNEHQLFLRALKYNILVVKHFYNQFKE